MSRKHDVNKEIENEVYCGTLPVLPKERKYGFMAALEAIVTKTVRSKGLFINMTSHGILILELVVYPLSENRFVGLRGWIFTKIF